MQRSVIALTLAAALTSCATSNPDMISRGETQRMATVTNATVLSVRPVVVDGSQSGVGSVAGGVVGGLAGSSVGGWREGVAVGVLGAVAGALLGNAVERRTTREEAVEILLQLPNGQQRAIVQAKGDESFRPGDAVIIVNSGGKVRVSRDPSGPGAQGAPAAPAPTGMGDSKPAPVYGQRSS